MKTRPTMSEQDLLDLREVMEVSLEDGSVRLDTSRLHNTKQFQKNLKKMRGYRDRLRQIQLNR